MKHHWRKGAHLPDLGAADSAWTVASCSRRRGFVLRRFEHITSAEVRTWLIAGAQVGPRTT